MKNVVIQLGRYNNLAEGAEKKQQPSQTLDGLANLVLQ